jgi:integrase
MPHAMSKAGYNRTGERRLKLMNVRIRDGQWHYRFNFRGREYSGPTGLAAESSNRTAAEAVARAKRAELERRGPESVKAAAKPVVAMTASTPFSIAADAFLKWAKDVEYRAKPSTAERLRVSFQTITKFFEGREVAAVDARAIEAYVEHRIRIHQVRDVTVRHDLHALSVFFGKWAVRRGLAKSNPVGRRADGIREVNIPSDREAIREHVITAEEEKAYFAAADELHAIHVKSVKNALPNTADLARLMLEQGARPEELLAARVSAFDAAAKALKIEGGKTRAARRVLYLTPASIEILARRAQLGGAWLFPSGRHPGHHLGNLNTTHDRICLQAGVSFVIYDFRHTFATRAIERNVPVAIVAAILGHSSLRTIHRYVHPSADAQRAAMERYSAGPGGPRAVNE